MIMGAMLEGASSRWKTNATNAYTHLMENMDTLFASIVHELDIRDNIVEN